MGSGSFSEHALTYGGLWTIGWCLVSVYWISQQKDVPFDHALELFLRSGLSVSFVVAVGLSFGLSSAFSWTPTTLSVPFGEKERFVSMLVSVLNKFGYKPTFQSDTFISFKPSAFVYLTGGSGGISAQIEEHSATIVGPGYYLRRLQKELL